MRNWTVATCALICLFCFNASAVAGPILDSENKEKTGPKIAIEAGTISIDGQEVSIGQRLEIWRSAINGVARCEFEQRLGSCVWDGMGLEILTKDSFVTFFHIYFNRAPWGPYPSERPDGKPYPAPRDTRPKRMFSGVFELDGYRIDAKTQFWQIRANAAASRGVRCDMLTRSCGNTTAKFDGYSKIYMELNGTRSAEGTLAVFAVGGSNE
jgi:hypothetical protein